LISSAKKPAPRALSTGAVARRLAALDHETLDDAMEFLAPSGTGRSADVLPAARGRGSTEEAATMIAFERLSAPRE
jgi:hypothetical protein